MDTSAQWIFLLQWVCWTREQSSCLNEYCPWSWSSCPRRRARGTQEWSLSSRKRMRRRTFYSCRISLHYQHCCMLVRTQIGELLWAHDILSSWISKFDCWTYWWVFRLNDLSWVQCDKSEQKMCWILLLLIQYFRINFFYWSVSWHADKGFNLRSYAGERHFANFSPLYCC